VYHPSGTEDVHQQKNSEKAKRSKEDHASGNAQRIYRQSLHRDSV
jgi:hypothetical protein